MSAGHRKDNISSGAIGFHGTDGTRKRVAAYRRLHAISPVVAVHFNLFRVEAGWAVAFNGLHVGMRSCRAKFRAGWITPPQIIISGTKVKQIRQILIEAGRFASDARSRFRMRARRRLFELKHAMSFAS